MSDIPKHVMDQIRRDAADYAALKRAHSKMMTDTMSVRERHERIIADYVNGLRGEMSPESAAELFDAILTELAEPSEETIAAGLWAATLDENGKPRDTGDETAMREAVRAMIQHIREGGS